MNTALRIVVLIALATLLAGFTGVPEDVRLAPTCSRCGMDRTKYAHSRMVVHYADGTRVAVCSLHCLAVDLAAKEHGDPVSFAVADRVSKRLIDAHTAHWVIGGNVPGVMTSRGKWAFAEKVYAQKFIREHGGQAATFASALAAAQADLAVDAAAPAEQGAARPAQAQQDERFRQAKPPLQPSNGRMP